MQLTLIKNTDPAGAALYKLARVIYAETCGTSLGEVECLASMVMNLGAATGRDIADIAGDADLFESLNPRSTRHEYLRVDATNRAFQMCLRVVQKMARGMLPDQVYGATRFHRVEMLPDWAVARGYIKETPNLMFYL
ncbi:hypothetical protein HDR63_03130 [bacterium]|nr:hypothetical protein [bacterium]